MSEDQPRTRGVLESLRGIGDNAIALLQNRVELFGLEIQEQKERLVRVILLAVGMLFLGNMAALVVTATIVVLAGPEARKPVLIVLSVLYIAATVAAFLMLRKELRAGPPPLSDTVSELKKDRDWLSSQE
jgi:uncharacterized membrane protein YqjE